MNFIKIDYPRGLFKLIKLRNASNYQENLLNSCLVICLLSDEKYSFILYNQSIQLTLILR